jgi:hypothetical protein
MWRTRDFAQVPAVTSVAELAEIPRFVKTRQLMAYSVLVPSEDSRII